MPQQQKTLSEIFTDMLRSTNESNENVVFVLGPSFNKDLDSFKLEVSYRNGIFLYSYMDNKYFIYKAKTQGDIIFTIGVNNFDHFKHIFNSTNNIHAEIKMEAMNTCLNKALMN
jgi:hypothetical protein